MKLAYVTYKDPILTSQRKHSVSIRKANQLILKAIYVYLRNWQDRQYKYNVAFRRFLGTMVAVEKQ